MEIEIRQEIDSDLSKVYEINKKAFFNQENEAQLVESLRKSSAFIPELSLVAIVDNKIEGYILFSKIEIINNNDSFVSLALAPVAVNPDIQSKGIGQKLINYGINKAKELGYKSIIVIGHENYYPKFGFTPSSKWNIKPPLDVPENNFMALELVENGLKNISGSVKYPKEFDNI